MKLAFITAGKETGFLACLSHPVFKLFIAQNPSWIKKIKGKKEIVFKFFFYGEIVFKKDTVVDGYHVSGTDLLFFTSFIFYYLDVSRVRSYPLYFY